MKRHWDLVPQCAPSSRLVEAAAGSIMNSYCICSYTEMGWEGGRVAGLWMVVMVMAT